VFDRFTDRARRAIVTAQEEARGLHHGYIGTEHILLALLHDDDCVAARVLTTSGISLNAARTKVAAIVGRGELPASDYIPFTPSAKTLLELALRETLRLGHDHIGTGHLLLGLLRQGDSRAAQALGELGADAGQVRRQVVQELASPASSQAAPEGAPSEPSGSPRRRLRGFLVDDTDTAERGRHGNSEGGETVEGDSEPP
jgi:ATP-dependent Clp protease ATP-binding subunit ClpC